MSPLNIIPTRKRSGTSMKEMDVVKSKQAKSLTLEGMMMMMMMIMTMTTMTIIM
jgi:hypothetical protein